MNLNTELNRRQSPDEWFLGEVTLGPYTTWAPFRFGGNHWINARPIFFPEFTESCSVNKVTVRLLGEQYEGILGIYGYDLMPGDTVQFCTGDLTVT